MLNLLHPRNVTWYAWFDIYPPPRPTTTSIWVSKDTIIYQSPRTHIYTLTLLCSSRGDASLSTHFRWNIFVAQCSNNLQTNTCVEHFYKQQVGKMLVYKHMWSWLCLSRHQSTAIQYSVDRINTKLKTLAHKFSKFVCEHNKHVLNVGSFMMMATHK